MKKRSILIVDDNSANREMFLIACAGLNCEVEIACDGKEALRLFEVKRHSYVLTDYQMPVINGIDLVIGLRQIDPEVPCLLFTGYPDPKVEQFCHETDTCSYFTKPIDLKRMVDVIHDTMEAMEDQETDEEFEAQMATCPLLAGENESAHELRAQIRRLRHCEEPLILEGGDPESLRTIARFLHQHGNRHNHALVEHACHLNEQEAVWKDIINSDGTKGEIIHKAIDGSLLLFDLQYLNTAIQVRLAQHFDELFKNIRLIGTVDFSAHHSSNSLYLQLYQKFSSDSIILPAEGVSVKNLPARAVATKN